MRGVALCVRHIPGWQNHKIAGAGSEEKKCQTQLMQFSQRMNLPPWRHDSGDGLEPACPGDGAVSTMRRAASCRISSGSVVCSHLRDMRAVGWLP
jgi:hypothetical protein